MQENQSEAQLTWNSTYLESTNPQAVNLEETNPEASYLVTIYLEISLYIYQATSSRPEVFFLPPTPLLQDNHRSSGISSSSNILSICST
jgi:hypothetical protein